MAARSPQNFAEHMWRGFFYILLWGRAVHLQPFMLKELRRRLPDGTFLVGPWVRPRADCLLEMERKAAEEARRRRAEDARWTAWNEAEATRREAVGRLGPEAKAIREAA